MTEEQQLSKTEIISQMRQHQAEYAKYAALLKEISLKEDLKAEESRQMSRLEVYKQKYKFLVQDDGAAKEIDWDEIEKLVRQSLGTGQGYALGFNSAGDEGLGYDFGSGTNFTPMVEEERDAQKLIQRYKRIKEFDLKNKRK
jgi:hypothetical protein